MKPSTSTIDDDRPAATTVDKAPDKTIVDRSKRRSAAAAAVRKQRERLASNGRRATPYEAELVENFARNHLNAAYAMPLFVLTVALVTARWNGLQLAVLWFAVTTLSYLLLTHVCRRFLAASRENGSLAEWRRLFMPVQALLAIAWSLLVLYDCRECDDSSYAIVQFSSILVVQAVTTMLSYGLRSGVLVVCIPPTFLLAGRFMFPFDPATMIMAVILVGSLVFFYMIADRFKLSMTALLSQRAENEALIGELETARSISEEARRRAEDANLAKSRFLATMSHELRTPLNAILGFSEVIKDEVLGPVNNETYKDYVKDIHASGEHLLHVINEILDLSRIEAGRHEIKVEPVDLPGVVDEALHMIQLKAKNKDIELVVHAEKNLPKILADERAVRQIVLNLLSNALKFTPSCGTITVRVGWTRGGGQYLSIRDTGPGIPEDEIPVVLSSFGQGSIAIKSAEQGTGLGLPIVQALMHMHDGKFDLKSKLREGTEAIAVFPRSRVLEVMPPVDDDRAATKAGISA